MSEIIFCGNWWETIEIISEKHFKCRKSDLLMAKYYKVWFFFSTENTIDYKCWMRENLRVRATKLEKEPKRKKTTFINTSLKIMTKWKKNYSNLYLENNFRFIV